jgi:hypothetical protein
MMHMMHGRGDQASTGVTKNSRDSFLSYSGRLLNIPIRTGLFLDHNGHAEYARPNEFELVLSAVQAMA